MNFKEFLSIWGYRCLWWWLLPVVLMRNWMRSFRQIGYRQRWWQRMGWVPRRQDSPLWVHAVSVGEVAVAIALIEKILAKNPSCPIIVTTMTPTGASCLLDAIQKLAWKSVQHLYAPYDHESAVALFMKRVAPRALLMIETEIWPNWVLACQRNRVKVALVNGRMSEKSALSYAKFGTLSRLVLKGVDALLMQAVVDANRIQRLGAVPRQIEVTGSIKQDIEFDPNAAALGKQYRERFGIRRPIWIAASTHEGEEVMMLEVHQQVLTRIPDALLLIVPRHPDRFAKVADILDKRHCCWQRHSDHDVIAAETQVILGDSLGELLALLAASDVAVMAGSFVPVGGHNMLEAMVMAVPVLLGPHMFNFQSLTDQLLEQEALLQVKEVQALVEPLISWLQDPSQAETFRLSAAEFLAENRGALQRVFSALEAKAIFPSIL